MAKLKGRQMLYQGELTLENYMLNNSSIWALFEKIFPTIAAKL